MPSGILFRRQCDNRRGHPNLVTQDNRRRSASALDRRFPGDILRFAPGDWQSLCIAVPLAGRAAELGPFVGQSKRRTYQNNEEGRKRSHGLDALWEDMWQDLFRRNRQFGKRFTCVSPGQPSNPGSSPCGRADRWPDIVTSRYRHSQNGAKSNWRAVKRTPEFGLEQNASYHDATGGSSLPVVASVG